MIHSLLLNPAYTGKAIYGRRRSIPWRAPLRPARGHGDLPRRAWRQVPATPDQYITVPVPAIIDAKLGSTYKRTMEPAGPPNLRFRGIVSVPALRELPLK
jgi:site-specific DNA recombinase